MEYEELEFSSKGPIGFLTLNRPDRVNALSLKMINEMSHALDRTAADESIKVLIIRAAGKNCCAGHNLSELVDRDLKAYKDVFDQCTKMMKKIHGLPQPVIAQVQGIATAAGCQLAAWCDLVVAGENAAFATPGVKTGLFCSTPMVAVTRAIGRKAAMEMLLTGRYFPAKEARELGLVNRVVPLSSLEEETEALAGQIAEASRFTLEIGKQAFYAHIDQPDGHALDFAKNTIVMNNMAIDAQSGITAFLEKRTDIEWKNR
ncbi:MAG: enoyl-CoA hydratase [Thermodesulfobacteriota bacterium]|nr:enoyl-CoA hydratase [Thermodesulfobacteriota bacterium]